MTAHDYASSDAAALQAINQDLAALLHLPTLSFELGAEHAQGDGLIVCGLAGGKDVGKSTLINALAGATITSDTREVGRGTERPLAYVHEAARRAAAERLGGVSHPWQLEVAPHRVDAIRNLVLVDLPDFDSEFAEHAEIVRAVLPRLDRVIWVMTPRKIGDGAWTDLLPQVFKDPLNIRYVLNKVDELLADAEPLNGASKASRDSSAKSAEAFWQAQHRWVARNLQAVGQAADDDRRFLVAAAYPTPSAFLDRTAALWDDTQWHRNADERGAVAEIARLMAADLARLRDSVLAPLSESDSAAIKAANVRRERIEVTVRIRKHFDLDRVVESLSWACDPAAYQPAFEHELGPTVQDRLARAAQARIRSDAELAETLLHERLTQWPLLSLAYWPLGWLSRSVGRRMARDSAGPSALAVDRWDAGESELVERLDRVRAAALSEHARLAADLGVEEELPSAKAMARGVQAAADELAPRIESRWLDNARHMDRPPSGLSKITLWGLVLWFPLLQPVFEEVSRGYFETGQWTWMRAAARLVTTLSATHILTSLAVVLLVFVIIVAGMYSRRLRRVNAQRKALEGHTQAEAVAELLVAEVLVPLTAPWRRRLNRLTEITDRLRRLEEA